MRTGYSAAVVWGEISPDFAATPVLVAYIETITPLTNHDWSCQVTQGCAVRQ